MKLHIRLLLVVLFLGTLHTTSLGQLAGADSLLNLVKTDHKRDTNRVIRLHLLSVEYTYSKLDSAMLMVEQSLDLSEELNYEMGKGRAYTTLGNIYYYKRDAENAVHYYNIALELRESIGDRRGVAVTRQNLANLYAATGDLQKSADQLEEVKIVLIELKDTTILSETLNNLGKTYSDMDRYQEALYNLFYGLKFSSTHHSNRVQGIVLTNLATLFLKTDNLDYAEASALKSLKKFKDCEFNMGIATVEGILGNLYHLKEDYSEAALHYQEAINIARSINDSYGLPKRLINLGSTYFKMGEEDKAMELYLEGIHLAQNDFGNREYGEGLSNLGALFYKKGMIDSAIYYAERSIEVHQKLESLTANRGPNEVLSGAYADKGDYEKAYYHEKQLRTIRDSIMSVEKMRAIRELEVKYEAAQSDNMIEKLAMENTLNESKANQSNQLMWFTIVLFVFLALLVVVYMRSRKLKNAQREIELERTALRAQINPHFIFNSLNSIKRLYVEKEFQKASDYMGDFSHLLRSILENSRKSLITLEEELSTLKLYCEMEELRAGDMLDFEYVVEDGVDTRFIRVPPTIIQPFVENAIWHGILPKKSPGQIKIKISPQGSSRIKISVEDNGVGWRVSSDKTYNSRGIELIEKRIKTKVHVEALSPGTRVSFNIPVL